MDRYVAHDLLGIEGIDGLIVRAEPGQLQSVELALQKLQVRGADLTVVCRTGQHD